VKVAGSAQKSGEPDIDCCYRGRTLKLEVKRPGGPGPTPLQIAVLSEWEKACASTHTIRTVEEVKEIIALLDSKGGVKWQS
jgi:hypothetical protein